MPLLQHQIEDLQHIVIDYLQGSEILNIRERLQNRRDKHKESCKDLYKKIPVDITDRFIIAILGNLPLSNDEQAAYLSKRPAANLYELLTNLYHDDPIKYHHLRRLLVEVNSINASKNWALIFSLGALLSAGLGGLFYFKPDYATAVENWITRTTPLVAEWFAKTFSLLKNLPLIGIAFQAAGLAWSLIHTFANSTAPTEYKTSRLLFKTIATGLSIGAYALVYAAAGVTSPIAASLFILSSAVGVAKSLYILSKTTAPDIDPNSLEQKFETLKAYEIEQNMLIRNRRSFGIQFIAAILTTTAVAIMCIFPATILTFIACISFMWLVEQTRSTFTSSIHNACDDLLQEGIKDRTSGLDTDLRLNPFDNKTHTGFQKRDAGLVAQFFFANSRKAVLNSKAEKIERQLKDVAKREEALTIREKRVAAQETIMKEFNGYRTGYHDGRMDVGLLLTQTSSSVGTHPMSLFNESKITPMATIGIVSHDAESKNGDLSSHELDNLSLDGEEEIASSKSSGSKKG